MSGHSKWSNIKRKKEANDKVKGVAFSKLSRLITLAVIEGGGINDPNHNVKLRMAVEKARSFNMPKDNISRAIERGLGPDRNSLKEVVYEGFGPAKTVMLIQATSDNLNRTLSEIRTVLDRNGGKLGNSGSTAYMFKKCGLITFNKSDIHEEKVFDIAEKLSAFDIDNDSGRYYVFFPFENLGHIKNSLEGVVYESAEVDYKPQTLIEVNDEEMGRIENLVNKLEQLDDVHRVFVNV